MIGQYKILGALLAFAAYTAAVFAFSTNIANTKNERDTLKAHSELVDERDALDILLSKADLDLAAEQKKKAKVKIQKVIEYREVYRETIAKNPSIAECIESSGLFSVLNEAMPTEAGPAK